MLKTKSLVSTYLLIRLLAFASSAKAQDQVKIVVNSFEKIRKSEAALQYFFSRMPKGGDLHNHLTGSVYAETYFDIAVKERNRPVRKEIFVSIVATSQQRILQRFH